MRTLKQATATALIVFVTQASDHVTGLTEASLTITASKAGGAFGSIAPAVTERGTGWYSLALDAGMTDTLGDLALHITAASADPTDVATWIVARSFDDLATPAQVATELATYDGPTKAEMDAGFLALNDITVAEILAGVVDGAFDVKATLKEALAWVSGAVGRVGDAYTFKDRGGADLFTNTVTDTMRVRS